jgi:drug/metabolite transporter (DMT)-like permease
MRTADWLRMTLLAAIWGLSFLFLRMAAPVLGPAPTAVSRLLIGGGLLALYVQLREGGIDLRARWGHYALLGMLNSGLPFLLFSFAARSLPASYLILLNATTPLFGALVGAVTLGERLGARQLAALTSGMTGVAIVAGLGPIAIGLQELLAIVAGLGGAACYALATIQIRRSAIRHSPNTQAAMSQIVSGILLLPLVAADLTRGTRRYNLCLGILGLAMGIGAALSTTIAGFVADRAGAPVAFLTLAAIALAGTALLAIFMPETRQADLPDAAPRVAE